MTDDPEATVNWNIRRRDINIVAISEIAPSTLLINASPFFLDTGATTHITPEHNDFAQFLMINPQPIKGIGGSVILAIGIGSIKLKIAKENHITFKNVLYVPTATIRLISIKSLCTTANFITHFNTNSCWLTKSLGDRITSGTLGDIRNLYSLNGHAPIEHALISTHSIPTLETWHHCLSHTNNQAIYNLVNKNLAEGMPINLSTAPATCEHSILGKQTRKAIPKVRERVKATQRLACIYIDLTGPQDITSTQGYHFVMNLIDNCTFYAWSILLTTKDQAYPELKKWELVRGMETGLIVGNYQTNNSELKSDKVEEYLAS